MPTIVNVGYRSTNYWLLGEGRSRLLVDLGWPGMGSTLRHQLERAGVPMAEVRHGFATHYHLDHAGAAEELKGHGMTLVVFDVQRAAIPAMRAHVKPADGYVEIADAGNLVLSCADSRAWLAAMGFRGEVVHTPGHSDDSVSLLLDSGEVFTGDLTPEHLATEEQAESVRASWDRLRAGGATQVYPGHGRPYPMPRRGDAHAAAGTA